jgi:hypothetical protein
MPVAASSHLPWLDLTVHPRASPRRQSRVDHDGLHQPVLGHRPRAVRRLHGALALSPRIASYAAVDTGIAGIEQVTMTIARDPYLRQQAQSARSHGLSGLPVNTFEQSSGYRCRAGHYDRKTTHLDLKTSTATRPSRRA